MSESGNKQRTRTISWEEPFGPARVGRKLSGLEYLQKIIAGEIPRPPMGALMNFNITSVSEGRAVFETQPEEYHYSPLGMVHGGLAATLLDSAMGCAVHSMLPPGAGYATLEIKINYIRPLSLETGGVRCEAKVLHVGKRTATAEGRVVDDMDRLYAHGTTTCMVFRD